MCIHCRYNEVHNKYSMMMMSTYICCHIPSLRRPLMRSAFVMRLKTRLIILIIIFFIFFISFKIMEPELDDYPNGRGPVINKDSDYGTVKNTGKLLREHDIDVIVNKYVMMYGLNLTGTYSKTLWDVPTTWITPRQIHPHDTPEMGAILHQLETARITNAALGFRGTQLKMLLTLEGGQKVSFKPKWYNRDDIVKGKPYDGPDRHNGELAAFHLNRILNYRRSPLVVGKVIDMETDIRPVAEKTLLDTFYTKDGSSCFYGKCRYCKGPETGVCGKGSRLEGVLVLWLPNTWKFKNWRHPWGRTYRKELKALWETDNNYCNRVKHTAFYDEGPRLMDIIDAAVFDYLIGNADRHNYETFKDHLDSMLVMLDNAKSFGNPHHDELSILAPLYQCCSIRKSTWMKLDELKNGALSRVLREILSVDPIAPVLQDWHYVAMDRRLIQILKMVDSCVEKHGPLKTLITDKYSSEKDKS